MYVSYQLSTIILPQAPECLLEVSAVSHLYQVSAAKWWAEPSDKVRDTKMMMNTVL